jgi:transcriptional regulator with XRE-family HTH domain
MYYSYMSATLGGLIKDFRLQKNLSQLEIAFGLGWKEPSRLSRIEQGRVGNPKRKLLNRIMNAMKLTEEERNRLMLVGNYVPERIEIESGKKQINTLITKWQYPAIVTDYLWRIVLFNTQAKQVYGFARIFTTEELKQYPGMLQLLFNPLFSQNRLSDEKAVADWNAYLARVVIHFRRVHKSRTKERWYMDMIGLMMNNPGFRELWNQTQQDVSSDLVTRHDRKILYDRNNMKKKLDFDVFYIPIKTDPRFTIEYHTPHDLAPMKEFV